MSHGFLRAQSVAETCFNHHHPPPPPRVNTLFGSIIFFYWCTFIGTIDTIICLELNPGLVYLVCEENTVLYQTPCHILKGVVSVPIERDPC